MFWVKNDSQKQMPKIDFSKKGENTYFKTHNRFKKAYFYNRRPIWEALIIMQKDIPQKVMILLPLLWTLDRTNL